MLKKGNDKMISADMVKRARAFVQEDHHPDIYLFAECYNESEWTRLVTDDEGEVMNWRDVKNLMIEIVSLPGAEQGMCYPTASKELWQEARKNIENRKR
jgi:hypothetical protein